MESRHRLLRKRVEETTDRDPLVAWALALWLSRYSDPSYAPYREVAEAQLKAAREQGKMDSKWPLRAKLQTDPVIAFALLQAAQWRPQGLSLTWQEKRELDILQDRLASAAEKRIVEFETHAALQEFDDLAQSNPGKALELAAELDIPPGVYNFVYGAKLSSAQQKALRARVVALRIEHERLARRLEASQLERDFRQSYEARQPEKARALAERLFAPPPDFDVPVTQNKVATTLKASRLRYARVELTTDRGGYRHGVVQSIHASPLRIVLQDPPRPTEESNLSPPARLFVLELAPPLPDDILHSPPADLLPPEKRAWVAEAREELQRVLANPSGQRFWLLDFDDERTPPTPVEEAGPSRFALLELEGDVPPPPSPPPPKPMPTPPRAEVDRALREFREGLVADARTKVDLAGHTLVRHWKLLTDAEQDEVRAGLARQAARRDSRFANLEVAEPAPARLAEQLQPGGEGEVTRFGLLEFDDDPPPPAGLPSEAPGAALVLEIDGPPPPPPRAASVTAAAVLRERWRRLTAAVLAAARVEESYATAWLERHQRRLLAVLGGTPAAVDEMLRAEVGHLLSEMRQGAATSDRRLLQQTQASLENRLHEMTAVEQDEVRAGVAEAWESVLPGMRVEVDITRAKLALRIMPR